MTFNLNESTINHLFEHKVSILDICKSFMEKHQLAFFGYIRCYADSSCYVLSTQPDVNQYLLQAGLPLTPPVPLQDFNNRKYYYLVPSHSIYGEAMNDVSIRFNLYHPLDLIYRDEGYYEMFCYGINKNDVNKINYYLNNLHDFEVFAQDFRERVNNLIKKSADNKIILPAPVFEPVKHFIISNTNIVDVNNRNIHSNKYFILLDKDKIAFTKREYDCLVCLLQGKTAQETADQLFLSRRTVESYLEVVKQKTFSRNKIELIAKIKKTEFNIMNDASIKGVSHYK